MTTGQMISRAKALRIASGLTRNAVAAASDVSQGRLSGIERGLVVPTPEECRRLARVFGVRPETLTRPVVVRRGQYEGVSVSA